MALKKQLISDLINQTPIKLNYKQVIVIRKDLRMGVGKISSQAAHAAVLGVEKTKNSHRNWVNSWLNEGQAKVVVKVNTLTELGKIREEAEKLMLPVAVVHDMGLTQIQPGTMTCIGIGPAPSEIIDRVTKSLKLL
jgi:peptidyl-tRNA hydrolase, PTH2 family